MNDLHNISRNTNGEPIDSGTFPDGLGKPTTSQLFYKKLGAYLLLLYQSYLKGETTLEPAIKMALLRMVKFDDDFPTKIRMAQLDILQKETQDLNAAWDETKEILFPITNDGQEQRSNELDKTAISEYKEEVLTLLASMA